MTEAQLLRNIIGPKCNNLCAVFHWRSFHVRPGMVLKDGELVYRTTIQGDGEGFPDLVLVGRKPWYPRPRVLYRELKTDEGDLSPDQKVWYALLKAARQDVAIWRPKGWELIVATLTPCKV